MKDAKGCFRKIRTMVVIRQALSKEDTSISLLETRGYLL